MGDPPAWERVEGPPEARRGSVEETWSPPRDRAGGERRLCPNLLDACAEAALGELDVDASRFLKVGAPADDLALGAHDRVAAQEGRLGRSEEHTSELQSR